MSSTIAFWGRNIAIAGTHCGNPPVGTFVYPLVGMLDEAAVPGSAANPTTSASAM